MTQKDKSGFIRHKHIFSLKALEDFNQAVSLNYTSNPKYMWKQKMGVAFKNVKINGCLLSSLFYGSYGKVTWAYVAHRKPHV